MPFYFMICIFIDFFLPLLCLQEHFVENATLSDNYFIAACEEIMVCLCLVLLMSSIHVNNVECQLIFVIFFHPLLFSPSL